MKWRFLAFSCPHAPLEDRLAVAWMLDQIREYKPDVVVHLGDGHEADSASRFPSEYPWTLEEEFEAHNNLLFRIREAAPDGARLVFLPGNHDANLMSINRISPKLRGLCDYNDHEPELIHWEQPAKYLYDRERGTFRLGQVTFHHGYEATASADEYQSYLLGIPYGLTICGHTHKPKAVTQAERVKGLPLPYWYANAGCMRDIANVPYMDRNRRHEWGQAVVVGTAESWRYDKTMMPQERLWTAETRVFRMFNDVVAS